MIPLHTSMLFQNLVVKDDSTEDEWESGSEQSESLSFASLGHDQVSQDVKKDLIMVILCFLGFSTRNFDPKFPVGYCFLLC